MQYRQDRRMKTGIWILVLVMIMLVVSLMLCGSALANSWGLTGKLLNAVMADHTWDDYTTLSNQDGPFAVMKTRYHHALFYVDSQEKLHVYTTAVYQPEAGKKAPKLSWDGHSLTIRYGENEIYEFCDWNGNGEFQLFRAEVDGFRVEGIAGENGFSYQYQAEDDESGKAVFPEEVLLANFNIDLFPRSIKEVRHRNYMHARFESGRDCLGGGAESGEDYSPDKPGELLQPKKKGTAAVTSSPYGKSAWRAGKGKAAVGLNGNMWVLFRYRNTDGESYACIRYDVSERTQRIGYARCEDLGLPEMTEQTEEPGRSFVHIDVEATADTFLTDDPDVSQFQQFTVPKGTQFACLGLYNDDYAYVSAEVKNGKFVDGGAIVWGFVPIRDLIPMEQEKQTDVMEQLAGDWVLEAGGEFEADVFHFQADGTFTTGIGRMSEGEDVVTEGAQSGVWYVTKYNPNMNLYWDHPPYEITLLRDNGRATVLGLTPEENGFSLTFWEGGAGYVPYDGIQDSAEDHG